MKKIVLLLLLTGLMSIASGQLAGDALRKQSNARFNNVNIDGTLTTTGTATFNGTAQFYADILISLGAGEETSWADSDGDSVIVRPKGGGNMGAYSTVWKDGSTFLAGIDTTGKARFVGLMIDTTATPVELYVKGTGAVKLPFGTTAERPSTLATGYVRYNTTLSTFEGYANGNWGSLGGVIDTDRDTYISAENSAGADNDQLKGYTGGTEHFRVDSDGSVKVDSLLALTGGNLQLGSMAGTTVDSVAFFANGGPDFLTYDASVIANEILWQAGTSDDVSRWSLDEDGDVLQDGTLGVGISTAPSAELEVSSTSTSLPRGIMSSQFTTDSKGAMIDARKARGTRASPTTVVTGDTLTRWIGSGYSGSTYIESAGIAYGTEGTIGTTRVPSWIGFSTSTDAAPSVLTQHMKINSAGLVVLHDGTIPSWGHSPTGLGVEGTSEFDGAIYADAHVVVNDSLRSNGPMLVKNKMVINDSLRVNKTTEIKGLLTAKAGVTVTTAQNLTIGTVQYNAADDSLNGAVLTARSVPALAIETSPILITPNIGAATATSLAINSGNGLLGKPDTLKTSSGGSNKPRWLRWNVAGTDMFLPFVVASDTAAIAAALGL